MNVHISKNAELFFKALEDVWVAEQTWYGSPNNAVWHCTQAVEKTMKGFLRCLNVDYDHGHELDPLLEIVLTIFEVPMVVTQHILYFDAFGTALRYKNMSNDPSPEDAKIAITRAKQIMQEFNNCPKASQFMDEAKEVHKKMLRASYEKLSDAE
jgi:HEPN domain-containing protein